MAPTSENHVTVSLEAATKLAHYEIVALVGKGGMGEVYRARDQKLGREVAIKVLPDGFAQDAERLARFEREAKVLAALNHPNIAAIYGVEQSGATHYLVLELVPGETLAERIARGPIPVDEAIAMATEIAEALSEAHDRGIVHRDLKPANTKITPDDRVKVLDFGLAKAFAEETLETDRDSSASPTLTRNATGVGVLLGTAAYMSPEQARGKAVDKRTDVWAFGCVLYEMLTGKRLFEGETVSDTLAAVLRADPDWSRLPPVPDPVERLLKRCLARDPKSRLHDIADARLDLLESTVAAASPQPSGPAPTRSVLRAALWALSIVLAAAVGAVFFGGGGEEAQTSAVKFSLPAVGTSDPGEPVIAPDGRAIVYRLDDRLWLRSLNDWEAVRLPGSEGSVLPFWSPDGAWIGYFKDQTLWKVSRQGGDAQRICDLPGPTVAAGRGGGASWGDGGAIFFTDAHSAVYTVSDRGGDPRVLYQPDAAIGERDFHAPHALPDGRGVLVALHTSGGLETLAVVSETVRRTVVTAPGQEISRSAYSPTGHVLFQRVGSNDGIWAVPFGLSNLEATDEPFLVAPGGRYPSVSADGTLVYLAGDEPDTWQLVWVDRSGNESLPASRPRRYANELRLSPDGERVAASVREGAFESVWVHDLRNGNETRLTFDAVDDVESWLATGDRVLYRRFNPDAGETEIFAKAANGAGEDVLTVRSARSTGLSSDERYLVFDRPTVLADDQVSSGRRTIWVDDLEDADEARPLPAIHTGGRFPRLSPDNRWVSYVAAGTASDEIYLTSFPEGEGRWQVSRGGGNWQAFSPRGDEIFYIAPGGDLMSVAVEASGGALTLGAPERLFNKGAKRSDFDVAPDGARFLFASPVGEHDPMEIRVVQSWASEF